MDAFGGFFVDEKAVRVENIFLEFLKRYSLSLDLSRPLFLSLSYASDNDPCPQIQTRSEFPRILVRSRDRGHESEGIDHDVRRFLTRHPLQRRSPESHLRGISEVITIPLFLFVTDLARILCVFSLLYSPEWSFGVFLLKIRAISEECLQAICNGAETDFHTR